MREEVFCYSGGLKISACLYRPNDWKVGDSHRTAVISIMDYSDREDLAIIYVSERLAEEGYLTLARDYRSFGDPEGEKGRHRPWLANC